jgi:hypothetical protein
MYLFQQSIRLCDVAHVFVYIVHKCFDFFAMYCIKSQHFSLKPIEKGKNA